MTSEEESGFKLIAGRLTNDGGFPAPPGSVMKSLNFKTVPGLEQMFQSDYYQKSPPKVQEKLISSTISAARSFTKSLMQQDKNIAERINTEGYDQLKEDLQLSQVNE